MFPCESQLSALSALPVHLSYSELSAGKHACFTLSVKKFQRVVGLDPVSLFKGKSECAITSYVVCRKEVASSCDVWRCSVSPLTEDCCKEPELN